MRRFPVCVVLSLAVCAAGAGETPVVTPLERAALDRISAQSLRGNLSFLASDLLEGRDTPSRGLDIAAEYIAAQFRRAGLEPAGDDGYFQTATFQVFRPRVEGFEMQFTFGAESLSVGAGDVRAESPAAATVEKAPVYLIGKDNPEPKLEDVAGKVVILDAGKGGQMRGWMFRSLRVLRGAKPAVVLLVDREGKYFQALGSSRLAEPESGWVAVLVVHHAALAQALDAFQPGPLAASVTLHLPAPSAQPAKLRNVAGILRGSDPVLKDSYILVTAHYDHVGVGASGDGDRIYNGANDDGSGTVSVIEIAQALASLPERPRRSIVFLTFFGEEKGGYGARYYARHPIFPIDKTVADVNLEQLGRTDSSQGPQIARASFTGFDYSGVPAVFRMAGELTGVKVYKDEQNSDPFFARSDNVTLANQGIPAHTVCVAFEYPDYHAVGDHWEKIDYENMAKVDRMLALGVILLAGDEKAPRWDEKNPRVSGYWKAWKQRHAAD